MDAKLWKKAIYLYKKDNSILSDTDKLNTLNLIERERLIWMRSKEAPFRILWRFGVQIKPPSFNSFEVNFVVYLLYSTTQLMLLSILLRYFGRAQELYSTRKFVLIMLFIAFLLGLIFSLVASRKNIEIWEKYIEQAKEEIKANK
jgi:hypothetical protein